MAIVYCRVSTADQAEKGLSIIAQEEVCRAYAGRFSWPVSAICKDEGLSAWLPLDKRPGLVEAVSHLTHHHVLLIAKRDRIFRTDPFTAAVIERAVAQARSRIISVAGEGTDDDEPSSILMRRLLDAFGEYERLIIAARTRVVLHSKRARGEQTGQIPYGLRPLADGIHLEIDLAEADLIGLIRRLKDQGQSLRAIARALTVAGYPTKNSGLKKDGKERKRPSTTWSASTVAGILLRHYPPTRGTDPPESPRMRGEGRGSE